eukprot:2090862-Amphidinium_carterae.1
MLLQRVRSNRGQPRTGHSVSLLVPSTSVFAACSTMECHYVGQQQDNLTRDLLEETVAALQQECKKATSRGKHSETEVRTLVQKVVLHESTTHTPGFKTNSSPLHPVTSAQAELS